MITPIFGLFIFELDTFFSFWIGHILPYHAIICHLLCHGYSVFQILRCILKWYWVTINARGFTGGASGKEPACQCRRHKRLMFNPWVGKIPWSRKWQPTPVFLPGESHGQRSLAGCGPWDHKSQILLKQLSTAQHNARRTRNPAAVKCFMKQE